ncbi:hypothetical protein AVEN_189666-1 [Araneus ventricosus]|uniref:Uncharacterized protein n=1 Tax=Araneus ventricosus TaxID=182803 RepID=A0A4Y2LYY0_ARAVE|nr:hypothetical protein AVEN_189666-1 [Araneus ventricosus]
MRKPQRHWRGAFGVTFMIENGEWNRRMEIGSDLDDLRSMECVERLPDGWSENGMACACEWPALAGHPS